MPRVTARYFAALREIRGAEREEIEVEPGTTCRQIHARLFPGPGGELPVTFAVDTRWVPGDTVLADGVEVAFLPPVGGG